MDFQQRLRKAIERGQQRGADQAAEAHAQAVSEEECKRLHTEYRLELCEHIESCLRELPNQFPGFRFETLYGDRGWGAACNRDDLAPGAGRKRVNFFSRLEMSVMPYSQSHILELAAKGTVRNKEIFRRSHYVELGNVDIQVFHELVDLWVLEYAEQYAAR